MSAQTDLRGSTSPAPTVPDWVKARSHTHGRTTPSRWTTTSGFLRRHSVALACLTTLVVHLLSLSRQLGPDEGGFTMVARHWREPGAYLYGPSWVDRPPGLIGLFSVAQHLGPYGVRLTASVLAVVLVAALASAAYTLAGPSAARWTAWTAFAFGASTMLDTQQLNGELAASTLVAVSIAALVRAAWPSSTSRRRLWWAVLAGATAVGAVLMKQNFVDALAFAGVLLLGSLVTAANRRRYGASTIVATMAGFGGGALLVVGAGLLWARSHGGVGALAYAMYGFRSDAASVMAHWSWAAPQQRLGILVQVAVVSGLLVLLTQLAITHARALWPVRPLPWALTATVGVELFGVAGGGNFWNHYLIGLIPGVALTAGLAASRRSRARRLTQLLVAGSVAVTAFTAPAAALGEVHHPSRAYATGRWIAAAAQPGDTIVVPYTHANVIQASGLAPGYPYAWSLPARTRDPQLSLLTSTLSGPNGPTWVVRWDDLHTWGLDPQHAVDAALESHYRVVAEVCGHPVWLRTGVNRDLLPTPSDESCGAGTE
ncbi:MAG TPA: hypothetical protein VHO29_02315 [Marmoricola sp.]|nr:hypothetical protein [Marmoricola sp.]